MIKNGIILAGGTGSRLFPLTHVVNKHLLSVNSQFIIDYPLKTLKNMGVENVTVILGGSHFSQVVSYLETDNKYQFNFNYVYQGEPKGISQAISLCKRYVSDSNLFSVILGDNVFENPIDWKHDSPQILLHNHPELNRFGVASLLDNKIIKIEEKPKKISSKYDNYAITGCYLFDNEYFDLFENTKPSSRGEYEITDIIRLYNNREKLKYSFIDGLWSDTGTHESIKYVNNYFYNKS